MAFSVVDYPESLLTMKPLSPKETEILTYVLQEMSSAEIANQLNLSKRTVDTHRKNIIRKTQTKSLVGMVKYGIKQGLLEGYCICKRQITKNNSQKK